MRWYISGVLALYAVAHVRDVWRNRWAGLDVGQTAWGASLALCAIYTAFWWGA